MNTADLRVATVIGTIAGKLSVCKWMRGTSQTKPNPIHNDIIHSVQPTGPANAPDPAILASDGCVMFTYTLNSGITSLDFLWTSRKVVLPAGNIGQSASSIHSKAFCLPPVHTGAHNTVDMHTDKLIRRSTNFQHRCYSYTSALQCLPRG